VISEGHPVVPLFPHRRTFNNSETTSAEAAHMLFLDQPLPSFSKKHMSQDNVSTLVYSTLGRFQEAATHAGDKLGHSAMQNALQEVHADQRTAGKNVATYDANGTV
jgi:predicted GNAT family N-acyltransferase